MDKQLLATVVILLFCLLYTAAIAAQTKGASEDANVVSERAAAIVSATRAQVQQLGFGKRVSVQLANGAKTTGRITGLADEQFVVTNPKGAAQAIAYADVSRISQQKEKAGLFHRPWVAIMFTAAGVGTLIVVALQFFD